MGNEKSTPKSAKTCVNISRRNTNTNDTSKLSQCQRILAYIDQYGSITSANAMYSLGIFRLAARISDLRKRGYDIVTDFETSTTGSRYARYRMRGE